MRRRDVIALLSGAATALPLVARAQKATKIVVGVLDAASAQENPYFLTTAGQGLSDAGFSGDNVAIDYRWAEGDYDQLPALANDLVQREPTALYAAGLPAAVALKRATTTIPIVFVVGPDPVSVGLVTNLKRPGGNMTGVSVYTPGLVAKRLEFLHALVPNAVPIGVLFNPNNTGAQTDRQDAQAGAQALGLQIVSLQVGSDIDLVALAPAISDRNVKALLVSNDSFLNSRASQIIALAAKLKLPAIYGLPEFAGAGGLMSCNTSLDDAYRLAFAYVGRILKGEKSGNLPVAQPTKFQLVINLRTATALGLTVPPALLASADKVLQ